MIKKHTLYILFALFIGLTSCLPDKIAPRPKPIPPTTKDRTILMYVVESNLGQYLQQDVNELVQGAKDIALKDANLLVYYSSSTRNPVLIKITDAGRDTVKVYEPQNGATKETLKSVIAEVQASYPATSNGLILSSHGTGWLYPNEFESAIKKNAAPRNTALTKRFAEENGKQLTMSDLAEAIPDKGYDFIIFDACYMCSTEVLYELRNKCNYIVSSVAETWSYGMPYDKICEDLFAPEQANLKNICMKFYNFYNTFSDAKYQSGLISLVKTSELGPLTQIVKEIMDADSHKIDALDISPTPGNKNYIQTFDNKLLREHFQYDLENYIEVICSNPAVVNSFKSQLAKCVIASFATKNYPPDNQLVNRYCGLACYVPKSTGLYLTSNQKTAWYKTIFNTL